MEGYSRKDEGCPQLLDLIPRDRDWIAKREKDETNHGLSEEKKLELSLGPPGVGGGHWTIKDDNNTSQKITATERTSFGYFSPKNPVLKSPWQHQTKASPFLHLQPSHQQGQAMKESSQAVCGNSAEKKAFSSPPPANATAQKRTAPAPAPVVGWPPIRSFRKNIASGTFSKLPSDSPNKDSSPKPAENCARSLFVKINMDGIPIGRKVDLKAYDTYEKLSYAVDELFRGLLAAQRDCSEGEEEGREAMRGLLVGSGEYTLVYEDNEGDRMLVGDVPWHMFVSSVKRLRVLKSSELPKLSRGRKQGRLIS